MSIDTTNRIDNITQKYQKYLKYPKPTNTVTTIDRQSIANYSDGNHNFQIKEITESSFKELIQLNNDEFYIFIKNIIDNDLLIKNRYCTILDNCDEDDETIDTNEYTLDARDLILTEQNLLDIVNNVSQHTVCPLSQRREASCNSLSQRSADEVSNSCVSDQPTKSVNSPKEGFVKLPAQHFVGSIEDNPVGPKAYSVEVTHWVNRRCNPNENLEKYIDDAYRLMRSKNITEFRKLINNFNKNMINQKHKRTFLIHEACRLGDPDFVSIMLFLGANCSIKDDFGYMAQHYSVKSKITIIVDILALFGNDMNVKDVDGNTPLHHGVTQQNEDIIKTLMTYNVDPNIRNNQNELPIDRCLFNKHLINLMNRYTKEYETSIK